MVDDVNQEQAQFWACTVCGLTDRPIWDGTSCHNCGCHPIGRFPRLRLMDLAQLERMREAISRKLTARTKPKEPSDRMKGILKRAEELKREPLVRFDRETVDQFEARKKRAERARRELGWD